MYGYIIHMVLTNFGWLSAKFFLLFSDENQVLPQMWQAQACTVCLMMGDINMILI